MRRTNSNQRSHNRNNNSQRQNNKNGRSSNNSRTRNPNSSSSKQATKMWLQASSKTLTSHIPMISKNQSKDGSSNRKTEQNGGKSGENNRYKPKNKSYGDKQRSDKQNNRSSNRNRFQRKQNDRRPNGYHKSKVAKKPLKNETGSRLVADIEPFELFCAYHLGISSDKRYRPANINEVANRFRVDPATIRQALKDYKMDSASLLDLDFDMALAQLDIQVAPEGVDRSELAKNLYSEFLDAPHVKRDWHKILEEDRKENQKIFKD